ncbi:ATP-binding cassette domain-containing protein [Sphingobacterium sp. lm-10]|uniref:ATP-binding cassette domain-containing protein n=1 Tax=Sphingobacterium sp. lm-10 TaxID=2944904 RepID=UPI002020D00E|nr:ATP-binding cassette domain-containing protein [Sphingobacterium sp. lm-10]MCL7988053.1 ATP-binding cassette domain-containing protein [Sphingobacterium sp. lm-10]
MSKPLVHIQDLCVQYGSKTVLQDLAWTYQEGINWAIGGESGSGKTSLARALAKQIPYQGSIALNLPSYKSAESGSKRQSVLYIPNWYQFTNLEGDRNFYYQQRYNTHQGRDTRTVAGELAHFAEQENLSLNESLPYVQVLGLEGQMDSQLIELSSGEHKKLQLVKALWRKPQLLIIDEPYTGLDKASRIALNKCIDELADTGVHLILLTNDPNLPKCISAFACIQDGQLKAVESVEDFITNQPRQSGTLPSFLKADPESIGDQIIQMNQVKVRYGDKTVLEDISWTVNRGDKWVIQGSNGSGKSTLLSLINGDHPQAYGMDIRLFGNQRGSGESIWDIKQKIGLISPEMHWYFDQSATVWHTVASGFFDSIGLFSQTSFQQRKQVDELLHFFDLFTDRNELLQTLPLGKQRLALLARTVIKNPPLLVLDEPCQGLDQAQTQYFNDVVDELCAYGKTLLYVGHYESQLPKCIDHRLVLEKGQVIKTQHKHILEERV